MHDSYSNSGFIPRKQLDVSMKTKLLTTLSPERCVEWLRIWEADLSFSKTQYLCQVRVEDALSPALDHLPTQPPSTVRFYEWSPYQASDQLKTLAMHLQRYDSPASALFNTNAPIHSRQDESHMRKPIPISSQWLEYEGNHHQYGSLVIDLQHNGRDREAVVNGTAAEVYASKVHGHFRSVLKCCSNSDDRLVVLSSVDVHGYAPWLPSRDTNVSPVEYLFCPPVLTGGFDVTLCGGSRRLFIKLLVLRFFQVHFLLLQEESFQLLELVHLESRSKSRTTYDILWGDLEKLHAQTSHMIRHVDYVIDDVKATETTPSKNHLAEYLHWSQYQLNVARENLSQALKSQQRYHNMFERDQSQSEAQSLKRLTILAAIFLPLSLSSGMLAMQTRFKDLGDLLFDFVGTSVLIGSITMCIYFGLKVFYKLTRRYQALQKDLASGSRWKRGIASTDKVLAKTVPIALVVSVTASFLVGMFIDNHKGDHKIGFVFLGCISIVIILTSIVGIIRHVYRVPAPPANGSIHQSTCPQCFPK